MEVQGSDYKTKEGDKINLEVLRGKVEVRTKGSTGRKAVFNATKIEQMWLTKAAGRQWLGEDNIGVEGHRDYAGCEGGQRQKLRKHNISDPDWANLK